MLGTEQVAAGRTAPPLSRRCQNSLMASISLHFGVVPAAESPFSWVVG